jgi:hypothetical protein
MNGGMPCANVFFPSLVFSFRYVANLSSEFLAYLIQIFCRNQIYRYSLLSFPLHNPPPSALLHMYPRILPVRTVVLVPGQVKSISAHGEYCTSAPPTSEGLPRPRSTSTSTSRSAPHRSTLILHCLTRTHARISRSNMLSSTRYPLLRATIRTLGAKCGLILVG